MDDYPIKSLDPTIIENYLGEIPRPPELLYMRGTFPTDPTLVFLTVVGSRRHSRYGKDACEHLIRGLAGYPIVIVSGLAHGIDGVAHEAALAAGLTAVAFPGSGLGEKVLYPAYNRNLAKRILESGGCLLSEYAENEKTQNWMFPERNRLMAGLGRATLIIEATHKSGSRITTKLATDYNRDVLAVPGEIFNELAEGPNELIRLGATPITSSRDILEALGFHVAETPPLDLFSQCTDDEAAILKLLTSPKPRGDIIRESGLPTHRANILISQMEIKGLVKDTNGELRRC